MHHELRTEKSDFQRIKDGSRTYDVRDDDTRSFQFGDTVTLREYDSDPQNGGTTIPKGYTSEPPLEFTVGHVLRLGGQRVVFSLLPLKKAKKS